MKCPNCGHEFSPEPTAAEMGAKGGKKSKRVLTPDQAKEMAKKSAHARRIKKEIAKLGE